MNELIKNLFESSDKRQEDVELYKIALEEIEQEKIIKGVWAKALSVSDGDEQKTKSKYLEIRVKLLRDEKKNIALETERQLKESNKPTPEEVKIYTHNQLVQATLKLLGRIRGTAIYITIGGILSLLVALIFGLSSGYDDTVLLLLVTGLVLSALSIFLFINFHKMLKEVNNIDYIKKKITLVSVVAVIVSIVIIASGVLLPVLSLFGIFIFFSIIINLTKFHYYYKKHL